MAYYDALIAKWPSVTGANTQAKLDNLNGQTVAVPQKALLAVNDVVNAIAAADVLSLTATQCAQLQLLIGGRDIVDASPGTNIRAAFQSLFVGKATTLAALSALVTPYDTGSNNTQPWTLANGYSRLLGLVDLQNAGGLT